MKHTFTLLIVLTLSNSMHSYAQSLPSNNAYRDGDRVRKQLIEYKNLGRSGENVLWDLGEVEVKDSRYTVAYRNVDMDREQIIGTEHGRTYNNRYSCADLIWYTYDGNHIINAYSSMNGNSYYGAMHFKNGADEEIEYFYDSNGNTIKDLNHGI